MQFWIASLKENMKSEQGVKVKKWARPTCGMITLGTRITRTEALEHLTLGYLETKRMLMELSWVCNVTTSEILAISGEGVLWGANSCQGEINNSDLSHLIATNSWYRPWILFLEWLSLLRHHTPSLSVDSDAQLEALWSNDWCQIPETNNCSSNSSTNSVFSIMPMKLRSWSYRIGA